MNLTPGEKNMVVTALLAMAKDYRREADARRWIGPQWARVRAESRQMASNYETLAEQVKFS